MELLLEESQFSDYSQASAAHRVPDSSGSLYLSREPREALPGTRHCFFWSPLPDFFQAHPLTQKSLAATRLILTLLDGSLAATAGLVVLVSAVAADAHSVFVRGSSRGRPSVFGREAT